MTAPAAPGVLDIGDRWPLEYGGEGIGIECAAWPLDIYNPPFDASIDLRFFFRVAQRNVQPICHVLFLRTQQSLGMASLSLDSLPHPQSYPSAVGPAERRPIAQNRDAPTVSNTHSDSVAVAPNVSPNARLQNHDLIECIDLTASELAAWLASLGEPPISFVDTQMHTKGSVHRPRC